MTDEEMRLIVEGVVRDVGKEAHDLLKAGVGLRIAPPVNSRELVKNIHERISRLLKVADRASWRIYDAYNARGDTLARERDEASAAIALADRNSARPESQVFGESGHRSAGDIPACFDPPSLRV